MIILRNTSVHPNAHTMKTLKVNLADTRTTHGLTQDIRLFVLPDDVSRLNTHTHTQSHTHKFHLSVIITKTLHIESNGIGPWAWLPRN